MLKVFVILMHYVLHRKHNNKMQIIYEIISHDTNDLHFFQ